MLKRACLYYCSLNPKKVYSLTFALVGLLWSLAACNSDQPMTNTPTVPTPSVTPVLATRSPVILTPATLAPTPTVEGTKVATNQPIRTLPAGAGPFDLQTPTPMPLAMSDSWQYHWLKGIPCRAPCWEGITAGVTSASEMLEIMSKKAFVKNAMIRPPTSSGDANIVWNWSNGGGGFASFLAKTPSQIVYSISPSFEVAFRLSDIIQVYGEPSHVETVVYFAGGIWWSYSISFVFLNHGFKLGSHSYEKPVINSDFPVFGLTFFPVTTEEEYIKSVPNEPQRLVKWQGYKGFDFYCRNAKGQNYCEKVKGQ